LHSTLELPSILNRNSTLREWTEDPLGMNVLAPLYPQMQNQMRAVFGGDAFEHIGMDPMGFMMDTPLMDVLHFIDSPLPTSPEETVDELLVKIHKFA